MPYPAPPGPRIAYDLDGTKGFISRNVGEDSSLVELVTAALQGLNSDKSSGLWIEGPQAGGGTSVPRYWTFLGSATTGVLTSTPQFVALIFPTPMRIRGAFVGDNLYHYGTSFATGYHSYVRCPVEIQTSQDTTNGQDGNWTTILVTHGPPVGTVNAGLPGYVKAVTPLGEAKDPRRAFNDNPAAIMGGEWFRQDGEVSEYGWQAVEGAATRNVKGVRLLFSALGTEGWRENVGVVFGETVGVLTLCHLYGEPDTLADEDRLQFVTADGSAPMDFSWGDVYEGYQEVKQFKLRNLSDQDAENVDLSFVAPSPQPLPSPEAGLDFSLNGVTYSSSLSLSSIPAGTDSATIYVRLQVPGPGLLGPWGPRVLAEVGEWI